jgi:DNA primase
MTTMATKMVGTTDLADFLMSIGVDVRRSGQEISARCPVHLSRTGKEDRSPSWSMNSETGLWLCYSCGARGTLNGLVRELTGKDSVDVSMMLMNNSVEQLGMPKVEKVVEPNIHDFLRYPFVPKKYLRTRGLSEEAASEYGIRWDDKNQSWIIPIIDEEGHLLGWQEKNTNYTRNHPLGVKKGTTLFGIERVQYPTIVLVESPLDVVRFASSFSGMSCVATFGAQISKKQMSLLSDMASRLIVALDNDEAGTASAKKIFSDMPHLRGGVYWLKYSHTHAKDIGDMTEDEIEQAILGASVVPWWV